MIKYLNSIDVCKRLLSIEIERKLNYMMVYPYEKGETSVDYILLIINGCWLVVFCPICLGFLKKANFMISELDFFETIFAVFGFLFFIAFNLLAIFIKLLIKNNRNKKIQEVMKFGYKTGGKVLSIENYYKRIYGGPNIDSYWLIVQYIDRDGVIKTFKTVPLSVVPKHGYPIICDVFIYNNKCYAYNFSNFYIYYDFEKTKNIAIIIMMIFIIILSMLCTLVVFVV